MATSILVGQSAGRGEVAKIRRAVGTSGGLFLIAGVLITIASWLAAPWILRMLVTPHDVFPFALAYLRIITLVMPSVFIFVLRSEEHPSELQSLMRISYGVFCFKKKT